MDNIFNTLKVKNTLNLFIVEELIKYYNWIYSNYTHSSKSSKENYYKLNAIKKSIEVVSRFTQAIKSGQDLKEIKGIGPKTIQRIDEIIKTGKLSEIGSLNQIDSIKELASLHGIGPTKASEYYEKYGIKTVDELINASKLNKIELSTQTLLALKYRDRLSFKIPRILIAQLDIFVHSQLYSLSPDYISTICGSYRRGKDYSADVDILITNKKLKSREDTGKYLEQVLSILSKYFIVDSLTTSFNTHYQGFASFSQIPDLHNNYDHKIFNTHFNVIRLDIIVVPIQYYYSALMHFTGSRKFNQKMRLHAKSLGYKLSEYGLEPIDSNQTKVKIKSEHDIFRALLFKYIPPEKR